MNGMKKMNETDKLMQEVKCMFLDIKKEENEISGSLMLRTEIGSMEMVRFKMDEEKEFIEFDPVEYSNEIEYKKLENGFKLIILYILERDRIRLLLKR